ncbi:MAG: 30S ribosomal protein S20 [Bdellovibrionaceae bacterium]|nr:30S ribosomal protein S20 [Pseudobdellovibrionaceae bacterium]
MANHKSCEKRARQAEKRAFRNTAIKRSLKTMEKKLIDAASKKAPEAGELLKTYTAKMMQAVAKGVLKKQTMSRKLGRVHSKTNSLLQA